MMDFDKAFRKTPDSFSQGISAHLRTLQSKEEVVVKKKLSVGLIVAVVLILAAVTALAIVHFNEYAVKIADMEAEKGRYDIWIAEDRIALVRMLVESGALPEDDRVKTLLSGTLEDAAASALATEIILAWGPVREDVVSLTSILETVKGPMGHWSPEDKAWYTDLLREKGTLGAEADHVANPIMPTGDGLSQGEAEKIAFDAIAEAYEFDPAELAAYKAGAEFYAIPSLNTKGKWLITFYPPHPDGGHKGQSGYSAVVDPQTGEVVADPEAGYETPAQRVAGMEITPEQQRERAALYDTKGHHFYWSHEERALYLPDRLSLPDPDAIPEDEAIRIAWETARNHGQIIPEKLAGYDTIPMYCPAIPDHSALTTEPYWLVVLIDNDPQAGPYGTTYGEINFMLNATSGEVFHIFGFGEAYVPKESAP